MEKCSVSFKQPSSLPYHTPVSIESADILRDMWHSRIGRREKDVEASEAPRNVVGIRAKAYPDQNSQVGIFLRCRSWSSFRCASSKCSLRKWPYTFSTILMLVPASLPFFQRYVRIERVVEGRTVLRGFLYMGGAMVVASLLLRAVTAGPWRNILREWTIF